MEKTLTISILLGLGAGSLLFSFLLDSVFLVFIGLALIIWGTSLVFMSSTKLVKADLVIPQLSNSMLTMDNLLKNLDVESNSIFLPPNVPGENPVQKIIGENSRSLDMSLIPSGLDLEFAFEKKSKVDFLSADLDYLTEFLPIVFTDELGLATDLEISSKEDIIHVKMRDFILQGLCENIHKVNDQICKRTPCPVCSALACALTKVTHKAISIEKTGLSDDTLELWFKIHAQSEH